MLSPLLDGPVRTVRRDAARALAALVRVDVEEYVAGARFNADRPESRLNLSLVYAAPPIC
jgi:hypothetical protein